MTSTVSRVERVAMELYQIDSEDAAGGPEHYQLTVKQSWGRIGGILKSAYRRDAARLLRVAYGHERSV